MQQEAPNSSEVCVACTKDENDEQVLLCDGCPRAWHTYCIAACACGCKKKASHMTKIEVPEGDFFCKFCKGKIDPLAEGEKVVTLAYGFGDNEAGQLGLGDEGKTTNRNVPTLLKDLQGIDIAEVKCGGWNSMLLTNIGEVYMCGDGENGKTGNSGIVHESMANFRLVENLTDAKRSAGEGDVKGIVCSRDFSACVTEHGHIYTWGNGEEGKLGHQSFTSKKIPTKISAFREDKIPIDPRFVALGWGHILCVTAAYDSESDFIIEHEGVLCAWGSNRGGQLGLENTTSKWVPQMLNPSQPEHASTFFNKPTTPCELKAGELAAIAAGKSHSMALTKNGEVYTWGGASVGQLGHGKKEAVTEEEEFFGRLYDNLLQPKILNGVWGSVHVRAISCGDEHCFAISSGNTVYGWGKNSHGQLGTGTTETAWRPVHIPAFKTLDGAVNKIEGGENHTLVLTTNSKVYVCGRGREGQLGLGKVSDVHTPTLLTFPETTEFVTKVTIAAGGNHSFVLFKTANNSIRVRKEAEDEETDSDDEPVRKKKKTETKKKPKASAASAKKKAAKAAPKKKASTKKTPPKKPSKKSSTKGKSKKK